MSCNLPLFMYNSVEEAGKVSLDQIIREDQNARRHPHKSRHLRYASFLIRIWQESGGTGSQNPRWRGSVESIQKGQKEHFTDMEALIRFIRKVSQELGISWDERKCIA